MKKINIDEMPAHCSGNVDIDAEVQELPGPACGRCYAETDQLFPANCAEKPERFLGAPLGMYHCPDCGAMVLAGVTHPPLCKLCLDRNNPAFDKTCVR